MPGVLPYLKEGPDTREVVASVTGGQLVETDGAGMIRPAAAGSITWLGVAANDAEPAGSGTALDFGHPRPEVAVYYGVDIDVTYAAAATEGQLLIAAAAGQVTPVPAAALSATFSDTEAEGAINDTRAILGKCTEPGGVSATATGRARIFDG